MSQFNNVQILGIDYGEKVTGLSTYCPGRDPFPLLHGRIIVENNLKTVEELKSICDEELVDIIVLGLPFLTDGTESTMTKKVRDFGKMLEDALPNIKLYYQDETLSTYEASERMKNDPKFNFKVDPKSIDTLSAAIIIEAFINDRK
jgi:putative Holliday junction resolvase